VLELAVAVELVAEQVPQAQRAGTKARSHLGQSRFIDLEQSQFGPTRVQERRCNAGHEVGARVVVRQLRAGAKDARSHRRCRGLAVRGREEGGAKRQARGEPIDCAWVELPEQLPRDRRAAAGACEP
jgi:hypothetical protein